MKNRRVWVIGNRGMLGQELCRLFDREGVSYVGSDLEVSILDPEALLRFGQEAFVLPLQRNEGQRQSFLSANPAPLSTQHAPPFWIVNCAAYTAVDKAEDEPEKCFALNAEGPRNIARVEEKLGAGLIHLSTDYVFDGSGMREDSPVRVAREDEASKSYTERTGTGTKGGYDSFSEPGLGDKLQIGSARSGILSDRAVNSQGPRPYREEDPVNPLGVYGKSKAVGEEAVRQSCTRAVILRTAWLYGKHGNNFVYTMLHLMKEREVVRVVNDQRGSPTWAADLARAILAIIQAPNPTYGIFHFTNGDECTWYEFAREIYRLGRELSLIPRECRIEPITTAEYPTKAKRPQYSVLSKEKIQRVYGVPVPPWKESLERFLTELSRKM